MTLIYQLIKDGDVIASSPKCREGLLSLYDLAGKCIAGNPPAPYHGTPQFQLEIHLWGGCRLIEIVDELKPLKL